MNELWLLIINYYEYYFELLPCLIASLIFYSIYSRKHGKNTIGVQCFLLTLIIMLDFLTAIWMKHHFVSKTNGNSVPNTDAIILEILISIALGILYVPLSYFLSRTFNKILRKQWINNNKYGIIIFVYLLVFFILQLPTFIYKYVSGWYATNYSDGIGSRFFIGSILKLFYDDFLDWKKAYAFCLLSYLLIFLLIAALLNMLINHCNDNIREGVIFVVILFLVSPGSIAGIWQYDNFGRLEYYGLLLALISIVAFERITNAYLKYFIVTGLSCVSMAIYQGNIFMFYSLTVMLFVYDGLSKNDKLLLRRILGFVSVLITGCTFLFFQFFSTTIYRNLDDMVETIEQRTNLSIVPSAFDYEIFQPLSVAFSNLNIDFLTGDELPRESASVAILISLPVFVLILFLFLQCHEYRRINSQKVLERPYIYYICLAGIIFFQFVLNVDWGRWMISTTIVLFGEILYLIYKNDKGMVKAVEKLSHFIQKNMLLCFVVVVYIAGLGKYNSRTFSSEVYKIIDILKHINFVN